MNKPMDVLCIDDLLEVVKICKKSSLIAARQILVYAESVSPEMRQREMIRDVINQTWDKNQNRLLICLSSLVKYSREIGRCKYTLGVLSRLNEEMKK